MTSRNDLTGAISYDSGVAAVDLERLDEPGGTRGHVGVEITCQLSNICCSKSTPKGTKSKSKSIDWRDELQAGRICVQLLYSNDNRRQAEQVEAALQEWDLTQNQLTQYRRFSLYQKWCLPLLAASEVVPLSRVRTYHGMVRRPSALFVPNKSIWRVALARPASAHVPSRRMLTLCRTATPRRAHRSHSRHL
jgi:hypothetical protein